jgi:hypothetical protein
MPLGLHDLEPTAQLFIKFHTIVLRMEPCNFFGSAYFLPCKTGNWPLSPSSAPPCLSQNYTGIGHTQES